MPTAASSFNPIPTFTFRVNNSTLSSKFSPRLGQLTISRHGATDDSAFKLEIPTPGLICSTTRGVIQHLSRDNVNRTSCLKWVHVPFESFLQVDPPIPTRQEGNYPLHTFLGFLPSRHVLSLSLRDPADGREMPPNGKLFVAAQSSRGTRKVTCPVYRSYVTAVLPDIVFSLSDIPFTPPPHSQKRISKSIERSSQWLTTILAPLNLTSSANPQDISEVPITSQNSQIASVRLNVFLHMVGGIKPAARAAFAAMLQEPLESKEKNLLRLETLDDGVLGYVFDLVPLRAALVADQSDSSALDPISPSILPWSLTNSFAPLVRASLADLPMKKPRLVNTAHSPHEILALIRDAGVDLFDTLWAQQAATWGIALDFRFPIPPEQERKYGVTNKCAIGHNLYEGRYAHDFGTLADNFIGGLEHSKRHPDSSGNPSIVSSPGGELLVCACAACSPIWTNDHLVHSSPDELGVVEEVKPAAPYTRAYVHHLLRTHEMSAHALLAMHNLAVVDAFMRGVRDVLQRERELEGGERSVPRDNEGAERDAGVPATLLGTNTPEGVHSIFSAEVARFDHTYDAQLEVLNEARACWADVDRTRGKGRLARERDRLLAEGCNRPVLS